MAFVIHTRSLGRFKLIDYMLLLLFVSFLIFFGFLVFLANNMIQTCVIKFQSNAFTF